MRTVSIAAIAATLAVVVGCTPSRAPSQPEMVFVEGGRFQMGCTPEQSSECMSDERPVVEVELGDFWIGKYEVTNALFADFLNAAGNPLEGGAHRYELDKYSLLVHEDGVFRPREGFALFPVTNASWYGARAYAEWLSESTGKAYRLPTEAEWEYAARGGGGSRFLYSGGDELENVAWCSALSADSGTGWGFKGDKGVHAVGLKAANELGLHDMSGNVGEWCSDLYENTLTGGAGPRGPEFGSLRVIRGGSWDNSPTDCRISARNYDRHVSRFAVNNGFRVARD